MGRLKNSIYPVGISLSKKTNKLVAQFWDTTTKFNKVIGHYDTVEEAVKARNLFIKNLKRVNGSIQPLNRNLPKGVMLVKRKTKPGYKSEICCLHGKNKDKVTTIYLGIFDTINEAKDARTTYINKLL